MFRCGTRARIFLLIVLKHWSHKVSQPSQTDVAYLSSKNYKIWIKVKIKGMRTDNLKWQQVQRQYTEMTRTYSVVQSLLGFYTLVELRLFWTQCSHSTQHKQLQNIDNTRSKWWFPPLLPQEDAAPHQEETSILWTLYQALFEDNGDFPSRKANSAPAPGWRSQSVQNERSWRRTQRANDGRLKSTR